MKLIGHRRKLATALLSAVLVVGSLAGCTSAQVSKAGCTGVPNNIHQSKGTPSIMHGKVTFKCTGVSLTSHSMSTQIQKYTNGAWVNVGSKKNETRKTLSAGSTATFYTNSLSCAKGTYRYWAVASGIGNGISHSTEKYYSKTVTNPCG